MGYVRNALGKNEKIIVCARQHPIVLFVPFLLAGSAFCAAIAAALYAARTDAQLFLPVLVFGIPPAGILLYSYLKWHNEVFYVTTHRVVQCSGIINKRLLDSSLEQVNDVVLAQSWFGRIFDFGNVQILTASELGMNMLRQVRSPGRFKTMMLDQKEAITSKTKRFQPQAAVQVSTLMSQLEKLWRAGAFTDQEFEEKRTQLEARAIFCR